MTNKEQLLNKLAELQKNIADAQKQADNTLVYGVGISTAGKFKRDNKEKEYSTWLGILERCYCPKWKLRQPTYNNCYMSENFKNFQWFAEWCQSQKGFHNKGWAIDKDVLVKGNKIYSEDMCVFIPRILNNLITKRESSRGEYPIGVHFYKRYNKFCSTFKKNSKTKFIGYYTTIEEAFNAYKKTKEAFIKEQAEFLKEEIDGRVYTALMNYEVSIYD